MRHQNLLDLPAAVERLAQLAHDWKDVTANERSVFQTWLIRFCEALGVEPPVLPTDAYRFELPLHIFEQPQKRDPRGRARAVTTEIAGGLAQLAAELKDRGFDTERAARFLMRCVFSCFAEDAGLLPDNLVRRTLETARASRDHHQLEAALTLLWRTMDSGGMSSPTVAFWRRGRWPGRVYFSYGKS